MMVVQYIIVLSVTGVALAVTLYRLYLVFRKPRTACHGCSGCAAASLKKLPGRDISGR